ncbi:MAG: DUF1045 domain-containing protein [Acidimicrobiales bacterium]
MSGSRLAIYAAPEPGSWLAERTTAWLDEAPAAVGPPDLTATARHYGVHATLKPPFGLAPGVGRDDAVRSVAELAGRCEPVTVGPLQVATLGRFLALRPVDAPPALDDLASRCVRELDHLRRPPDREDLQRRRSVGLSARQDELLERWGYPYVLDEFRFHITLTRTLDPSQLEVAHRAATEWFDGIGTVPFVLDAVWVFEQPDPATAFAATERFTLGGPGPLG